MLTYQIIDHGLRRRAVGCGVAFTQYEHAVTGIGDSAKEAGEDALEQFHLSIDRNDVTVEEAAKLEEEIKDLSSKPSFDPAEVNEEGHHYVSIRWKVS